MRGSDTLCQHRKNQRVEKRKPRRKSESAALNTSAGGRKMYLFGCEEEEATTAAICWENERMRKVSVSDGEGGSLGAKVEKVIAVEAGTCSADAAEQQVNMHDRIQLYFHASMGFS